MNLLRRIVHQTRRKSLSQLAETVANDCHWDVWNCLAERLGTMEDVVAAQSYIRTRAAQIAHLRAKKVLEMELHGNLRWADPVAEAALDIMATRLAGPLLKQQRAQAA